MDELCLACYDLYFVVGLRRRHLHFHWSLLLVKTHFLWIVPVVVSVGIWDLIHRSLFAVCAAQRSALPLRARARAARAHEETKVKYRRFRPWVNGPATIGGWS